MLQEEIYNAFYRDDSGLPEGFVSAPSTDPRAPSPHLTGGAVDLTLTWRGQPLGLGTKFDAFTSAAQTDAFEDSPGKIRDLRRILYSAMRYAGFVVHKDEWWHFEYGTRRWAAITGQDPIYDGTHPK